MPKRKKDNDGDEDEKKKRLKPGTLFALTFHAALFFGNLKYHVTAKLFNQQLFVIKQYVCSLELGFNRRKSLYEAFEEVLNGVDYSQSPYHCHCFIRTEEPFLLSDLREILVEQLDLPLQDIEACKSAKSYVKYITKEDWQPVIKNYDRDTLHTFWKIKQVVQDCEILKLTDYRVFSIPVCYKKLLKELHAEYWNDINSTKDKQKSSPFKNRRLVELIKQHDRRGTIVWGESGVGKSSSVHNVISTPYFLFHVDSNFPMTNYNGERDIFIDDCTVSGLMRHRSLILQLTSGYSAPCEVKGGDVVKVHFIGQLYVTMNDNPDVLPPEYKRRFKVIHAL